ncbi:LuxR C-terminal-related transcriptional regulator [Lentzea alba]|uniref:helix-turn-helix transcriptional regulator n=1 Tax=Lentzea alba TaxID=2714351 RepID=UPI0039BFCF2A
MGNNGEGHRQPIRVHIACSDEALREVVRFTAERRGWTVVESAERAVVVTDHGDRTGRNVVVVVDPAKPAHASRVLRRISSGDIGGALSADRLVSDLPVVIGAAGTEVVAFSATLSAYADKCPALTDRQERVLRLIAFGLSYTTIAQRLRVSLATVKREVSSLFELFECTNQSQLVAVAIDAGFLQS